MAGRARDQRHDGRRGPAAAALPRHLRRRAHRGRRPAGSAPSSAPTAPGPTSTAARATCPPRSRPTSRCGWPATRRTSRTCARRPSSSSPSGGLEATRVFTRIWLALFGQWSWDDLPVIPPELIYLPSWFPLNIYDWGCWARQTIVPLAVVSSPAPVPAAAVQPGRAPRPASEPEHPRPVTRWSLVFDRLDQALHVYERRGLRQPLGRPARAVRRAALRRCSDWIIARQEADGCWGGIQPPWVYSLIGAAPARLRAEPPDHQPGAWPAWSGSRSGRKPRTAWCAGWRRASPRSGTPCWP